MSIVALPNRKFYEGPPLEARVTCHCGLEHAIEIRHTFRAWLCGCMKAEVAVADDGVTLYYRGLRRFAVWET